MEKLKRILVGIDIVEKSDDVLKRALMLAKENKADLFVVHAVQIPWLAIPNYYNAGEISIDKSAIEKQIEKKIKAVNSEAKVLYKDDTILVIDS
ncbi:universal stress protein [Sulfurovum sp.]|uniref:universal stress protein n=1 Tax=Sulfurovum sp. TaxID=1969726 RepID=UPI002867F83B|nr:universal stress protein [Sulfurovum sp.]